MGYDKADQDNKVLLDLRLQVYKHLEKYLKPTSHILELNAGTGIDALYLAGKSHYVHATDLSDGMIGQIQSKIASNNYSNRLTCQQVSFENLDRVSNRNFDYVLSNFGGLNCTQDLSLVTRNLPSLLKPGAYITWVIMPPVCPWELLGLIKGRWKKAFRRFKKSGTPTHLEGEYFYTYYHSLNNIRKAFGPSFHLMESEGLAALSPPPHSHKITTEHPTLYRFLRTLDGFLRNTFPFNRWADHIIVTFQYRPAP